MGVFKLSVYQLEQKCGTEHDPKLFILLFWYINRNENHENVGYFCHFW